MGAGINSISITAYSSLNVFMNPQKMVLVSCSCIQSGFRLISLADLLRTLARCLGFQDAQCVVSPPSLQKKTSNHVNQRPKPRPQRSHYVNRQKSSDSPHAWSWRIPGWVPDRPETGDWLHKGEEVKWVEITTSPILQTIHSNWWLDNMFPYCHVSVRQCLFQGCRFTSQAADSLTLLTLFSHLLSTYIGASERPKSTASLVCYLEH